MASHPPSLGSTQVASNLWPLLNSYNNPNKIPTITNIVKCAIVNLQNISPIKFCEIIFMYKYHYDDNISSACQHYISQKL